MKMDYVVIIFKMRCNLVALCEESNGSRIKNELQMQMRLWLQHTGKGTDKSWALS